MDSFERKNGIWWLPEDPENKYCGTLSFDPINGGRLEIVKPSNVLEPLFGRDPREKIDIIHGLVQESRVTLRGCYVIGGRFSMPGFDEPQILTIRLT